MAAPFKLAPNKAYPSIPTVAGTLENHTLVLEAVREALSIHERRTGNAGDSFVRLSELEETGIITIDQTTNIVVAPDDDGLFIRRDGLSPATTGEIDFGAGIWMKKDTAVKWDGTEFLYYQTGVTAGITQPGGVVIPTAHVMAYVDFEDGVGGNPGTGSDAYVNGADGSGQGGTYTGTLTDTLTSYGTYCARSTQGNFADTTIRIDEGTVGDSNVETAVAAGIPYHIEFRWRASESAGGNWIFQTMDNFNKRNLAIVWGSGNMSVHIGSVTSAISAAVSLNVGVWYHVALTCDSSGVFRLWIDGALIGSAYDASAISWDSNGDPTSWDFLGFHEGRVDNILILRGTALYDSSDEGGFTPPTIIVPATEDNYFIVGDPASVTHIDGTLIELENNIGINWDNAAGTNVEALVFGANPTGGGPLSLYTTVEPDALPTIQAMTVTSNVYVDLNTVTNRSAAMIDVSQLVNGEEYLLMAHSQAANSNAATGGDYLRLLDQSGTMLDESEGRTFRASDYGFEWTYFFTSTVDNTGADFKVQQKSIETSTRNMGYWDMAIPIGGLPASRWLWNVSSSYKSIGTSATALPATVTIDTAGDYWVFVNITLYPDPYGNNDSSYVLQLYDGTTQYGLDSETVEVISGPAAERYVIGAWIFLENVAAGTVLTPRAYHEPFANIFEAAVLRTAIGALNITEHFVEHYPNTDFNVTPIGTSNTLTTDSFTVVNSGDLQFFGHSIQSADGYAYIEAQKNAGGYTKYSESHRRDSGGGTTEYQAQRVTPLEGASGKMTVTAGDTVDVRFVTSDPVSGTVYSHSMFSILMETKPLQEQTTILGDPAYYTAIDGLLTTVSGALTVNGATQLDSTLGVTGAATLASTLDVASNTTIGGNTTIAGTLDVDGYSTMDGLRIDEWAETTTDALLHFALYGANENRRIMWITEDTGGVGAGADTGFYIDYIGVAFSPDNELHFGSDKPNADGTVFFIGERGQFRIEDSGNNPATLTATEHPFQIGPDNGINIRIGRDEIQCANNGSATELALQPQGGQIDVFDVAYTTASNNFRIFLGATGELLLAADDANENVQIGFSGADLQWSPGISTQNWDIVNWDTVQFQDTPVRIGAGTVTMTEYAEFVGAGSGIFQTNFAQMTDWDVLGLTGEMFVDTDLRTSGDLTVTGAITAASYGGITEANLLDLTAAETVSGAWTFSDELLALSYGETSSSPSSTSAAITFDLANGAAFQVTLTESITSITISNPPTTGYHAVMTVKFIQDATGSWTVTGWPAAVKWVGGSAPTITGTATTGTDIVRLETWDAGTTWYGTYDQNFS